MRVLSIVGARPQFVKLAPVAGALKARDIEHIIIHTGQHYDREMSGVFFEHLSIPAPNINLEIGSASHGAQTGRMLAALEPVLDRERPDWTVVFGDTNSTLAGALAAVKLNLPVVHVEAGLRSFNRRMPEEHNRVLVDHCSDLLLAPTDTAMRNLALEGLADRAVNVGDVMAEVCLKTRDAVATIPLALPAAISPDRPYLLATIHRAENTDERDRLAAILAVLHDMPVEVLLLPHPRLLARAAAFNLEIEGGSLHLAQPLAYPQMIRVLMSSVGVVTDSGGLQKEAYLLCIPCTTLRSETEWVETLINGWNLLDPELTLLKQFAVREVQTHREHERSHYGRGDAAKRIVACLQERRAC
jgi:UDP-N-acetylglucosamine 2-epimerase (non-hydrolysing)